MGKKGRKTRWRRLPIGGPESNATSSPPVEEHETPVTSSPEHRVTFNEDEYTKITTPRQDVLFKKGYLGRRRTTVPSDAQEVHSADSVESEYIPEEPAQFAYMPPTGFIDPSGVMYVNSGTYEIYDPYSGNVTVVVGPAPQYPPQPVLAAMPCQPVPLNPLEWFNPPAPWVCPYNNRRKRYSTDSQNCSAQSSESTGPPGSPQELPLDDCAGAMFPPQPPPYIYPGYMFGAPVYNMNGVNVQGVIPQPQQVPVIADVTNTTSTTTKRRKKRRRRRRGGATDEGSESSCEDVTGCDVGVCSQSGASSDAGQGSSCSKTNSDSGINTEPTPDSGSNTPPPMPPSVQLSSAQSFDEEPSVEEDYVQQQSELEIEAEIEPISSSISTPEVLKRTFESLPSEDGETLQELSCSSEINEPKLISSSSPETIPICCNDETLSDKSVPCLKSDLIKSNSNSSCLIEIAKTEPNLSDIEINENPVISSSCRSEQIENEPISNSCSTDYLSVNDEIVLNEESDQFVDEKPLSSSCKSTSTMNHSINSEETMYYEEKHLQVGEKKQENDKVVDNKEENHTYDEKIEKEEFIEIETKDTDIELCSNDIVGTPAIVESIIDQPKEQVTILVTNESNFNEVSVSSETVVSSSLQNLNAFSSHYDRQAPVPPPRRRRSLYRAAEKVASKVVNAAIQDGVKEAACVKCQHALPITEAVTRWLQSQGSIVLSPADSDDDEFEIDEGIEEGEGSTNQKNVEGNPFLVPYHSGSRQRVADTDECGSLVSSAGEWDMYDHESHTRAICDPATSVDKYYRLGADDIEEKVPSPSMIKTAVHIRRAGPFPCGVCCIIQ